MGRGLALRFFRAGGGLDGCFQGHGREGDEVRAVGGVEEAEVAIEPAGGDVRQFGMEGEGEDGAVVPFERGELGAILGAVDAAVAGRAASCQQRAIGIEGEGGGGDGEAVVAADAVGVFLDGGAVHLIGDLIEEEGALGAAKGDLVF